MSKVSLNHQKAVLENKRRNLHIRKGDTVFVLSGDDRGKTGEVVKVFKKSGHAIVGGINLCKRVVAGEDGGKSIADVEAKVHVSNLKKFEKSK